MTHRPLLSANTLMFALFARALPLALVVGPATGRAYDATRDATAPVLMAWPDRVAASDQATTVALLGLLAALTVGHLAAGWRRPGRTS